ncbi:MAG: LTA synthase family protein [Oscillospiraceae bacterium]|nr:LTA synthase family protein [Blautia sp.]MBR3000773.1 LTA synthase family protein [Oscillospiraceae bacterium]
MDHPDEKKAVHLPKSRGEKAKTGALVLLCMALAIVGAANWSAVFLYENGKPALGRSIMLVLIWLFCVGLSFLSFSLKKGRKRIGEVLFFLLSPFYIFLVVELITAKTLDTHTPLENIIGEAAFKPQLLGLNVLLIFLFVLLFTGLTNSLTLGPGLAAILGVVYSIVNFYVDEFRGNSITAGDFMTVGTAVDVAGGYTYTITYRIFLSLILLALFLIIAADLGWGWLFEKKRKWALAALLSMAIFAIGMKRVVFSSFLRDQRINISYFQTMRSCRTSGTILTLARSVSDVKAKVPEGYSAQKAREIASRYQSDSAVDSASVPSITQPNILVVINESFADMQTVGRFSVDQDYMAFMSSLKENCVRGTTYASVRGGMTANTEFEFLTNHSCAFLPSGTVPFQLYIDSPLPSMATWARAMGYCGINAMHPYTAENYRRNIAYPMLGFENFYHKDNVPLPLDIVRKYPSDASDYRNLLALFAEVRKSRRSPYFFYNMTVQNHSPYNWEESKFPVTVRTNGLQRDYPDVNQYLSLIRLSDHALKYLVDFLSKLKEPTVLLFMGDHQPKLSDAFLTEISGIYRRDRTTEEMLALYEVPFVIWANFDMKEGRIPRTSMNYMQTNLLRAFHGKRTGYQKFLADLQKEVPVINAFGYIAKDGSFYEIDDKTSSWYEMVHEYEILEYNCLFDKENRVENFFDLIESS